MNFDRLMTALRLIEVERDLNAKALLLAALVSELFRERGFEPVIVGGSAIEFYTDGASCRVTRTFAGAVGDARRQTNGAKS